MCVLCVRTSHIRWETLHWTEEFETFTFYEIKEQFCYSLSLSFSNCVGWYVLFFGNSSSSRWSKHSMNSVTCTLSTIQWKFTTFHILNYCTFRKVFFFSRQIEILLNWRHQRTLRAWNCTNWARIFGQFMFFFSCFTRVIFCCSTFRSRSKRCGIVIRGRLWLRTIRNSGTKK